MGYVIVRAGRADVAALADQRLAFLHALGRDVADEAGLRADMARYVEAELDDRLIAFLARDEGTGHVVGSALLAVVRRPPGGRHGNGRMGLVLNVYTEPAHRRRGVARGLLEAVVAAAREAGIDRLELAATPAGLRLYEAVGFTVDRSGNVPMELLLGPAS